MPAFLKTVLFCWIMVNMAAGVECFKEKAFFPKVYHEWDNMTQFPDMVSLVIENSSIFHWKPTKITFTHEAGRQVVYIFRNFNPYILQSSMKNNKEERRSEATGTGVSQKDLQLGKTKTEKKALEKLVVKVRAHCKLKLGAVRCWKVTRA